MLLLAVVMLVACGSREDRAVRRAVERQMKDFPRNVVARFVQEFLSR